MAERLTSYETWQAVADGWERWHRRTEEFLGPVGDRLVRAIGPRPGDTVLELCAGPGETGFRIAESLGPRGRLVSSDFAPRMVEVARRRGAALGLRNVEHRVMDAQHIDLETGSVDGVVCRFGYMLMDDRAAALAETRRVLRPGGRLALAVWGPMERNPWASVRVRFLVSRGHIPPPAPGEPGAFAMADAVATRTLLEDAGFADVRTEEVPVRLACADLADFERWAVEVSGAGSVIRGLPEREREVLRAELATGFAPHAEAVGYAIPGLALCVEAAVRRGTTIRSASRARSTRPRPRGSPVLDDRGRVNEGPEWRGHLEREAGDMTAQEQSGGGPGALPPPADLEGMEVRDAEGEPVGRVADVYVERVDETVSYVAVEGDSPDDVRLVPAGIVQVVEVAGGPALSAAVEGDRLLGGPAMERGAPVSLAHEQEVAGYFRDLHGAGYMRPWAEAPEVHGAGYMRPGAEPIEIHGAGYMRPEGEPAETHGAGYMRPEGEPAETHGAGYMRPEGEPPEVGGAGRMDPALLSAVKRWRE